MKPGVEVSYGLREKESGELLRIHRGHNGNDRYACGEHTYYLETYGENVWKVTTPEGAEFVRQFPTKWYNSDYMCPGHGYEPEELEVVQIKVSTEVIANPIILPDFPEGLTQKELEHFRYDFTKYEDYKARDLYDK